MSSHVVCTHLGDLAADGGRPEAEGGEGGGEAAEGVRGEVLGAVAPHLGVEVMVLRVLLLRVLVAMCW